MVVDYAHTPDALERRWRPGAGGQAARRPLWCVFGCGGDRDAGKRPLMGEIAMRHAEHVVVTSDNPRREAPQAIIGQILAGRSRPTRPHDRYDRAGPSGKPSRAAAPNDVVLLAGKGHEYYQEIGGARIRSPTSRMRGGAGRAPPSRRAPA